MLFKFQYKAILLVSSVFFSLFISINQTHAAEVPETIPGTISWYDAASSTTASANLWEDLIGNQDLIRVGASSISYTTFNGMPMFRFNNQSSRFDATPFNLGSSTSTLTVYIVYAIDTDAVVTGAGINLGGQYPVTYRSTVDGWPGAGASSTIFMNFNSLEPKAGFQRSGTSGVYSDYFSPFLAGRAMLNTYILDGTSIKGFLNGRQTTTASSPGYLGNGGVFSVGDMNGLDGFGFVDGYIGEIVIRNTVDATSTRRQFETYFENKWGMETAGHVDSQDVWTMGDSITSGAVTAYSWPARLQASDYLGQHDIAVRNAGQFGTVSTQASSPYYNVVKPYLVPGNIVVTGYGSNDIANTVSTSTLISNMTSIWSDIRSLGGKIYVGEVLPRSDLSAGEEVTRGQYNSYLSTLKSNGTIDGVIKYTTDSRLATSTNATYFYDESGTFVHPTSAGLNIMSQLVLDTLYGAIPENISSSTTHSTATITWTTLASSTSQVEYGLSSSYTASSTLDLATTTSHSVILTDLTPSTTYHFRVRSTNYLGELATSSDLTFTTGAAPVTGPPATGGGGGQITYYPPTSTPIPSVTPTPTVPTITPFPTSIPTPTSKPADPIALFSDFKFGMRGEKVRDLQRLLIAENYLALGNDTGYFGVLTRAALEKYKVAKGLVSQLNFFFSKNLTLGSKGEEVKNLQIYLNSRGYQLAYKGPGSPGNETLVFGYATRYQLKQFQLAHGIVPAIGYLGPKTRQLINQQ